MKSKTLTIGGKEVEMIYCAATENGYEAISEKSISVFVPTFGKDDEGNDIIIKPAEATIGDMMLLALAGIVAAATRKKETSPIDGDYILYDATPEERNALLAAILELRNEWYALPKVVSDELTAEAEAQKKENKDEAGDSKNA